MKIHGRCHCGEIHYTAEVNPKNVMVCHCVDCQIFSGAPFRASVKTESTQVNMTGNPTEYVKTADSGNRRVQGFCSQCGSNIYTTALDDRSLISLRLGCVQERDQLVPSMQIWGNSALEWARPAHAGPCHVLGPDSELEL